ncbi:MAG: twitching motility protein PilT [Lachnospiraceae bacterium]|nr:twitching motility protein PilT [Lachnospiraceae bacterium]
MIQLIVGEKGKGKTKHLLEKVNASAKTSNGNIVYLDKNSKHMYELNNKIRLINASEYPISSEDEFVGFVCGIVSQDHDLEQVYLDSFMDVAYIKDRTRVENVVKKLDRISDQFKVDFIISVSLDSSELSEYMQSKVIVSL